MIHIFKDILTSFSDYNGMTDPKMQIRILSKILKVIYPLSEAIIFHSPELRDNDLTLENIAVSMNKNEYTVHLANLGRSTAIEYPTARIYNNYLDGSYTSEQFRYNQMIEITERENAFKLINLILRSIYYCYFGEITMQIYPLDTLEQKQIIPKVLSECLKIGVANDPELQLTVSNIKDSILHSLRYIGLDVTDSKCFFPLGCKTQYATLRKHSILLPDITTRNVSALPLPFPRRHGNISHSMTLRLPVITKEALDTVTYTDMEGHVRRFTVVGNCAYYESSGTSGYGKMEGDWYPSQGIDIFSGRIEKRGATETTYLPEGARHRFWDNQEQLQTSLNLSPEHTADFLREHEGKPITQIAEANGITKTKHYILNPSMLYFTKDNIQGLNQWLMQKGADSPLLRSLARLQEVTLPPIYPE